MIVLEQQLLPKNKCHSCILHSCHPDIRILMWTCSQFWSHWFTEAADFNQTADFKKNKKTGLIWDHQAQRERVMEINPIIAHFLSLFVCYLLNLKWNSAALCSPDSDQLFFVLPVWNVLYVQHGEQHAETDWHCHRLFDKYVPCEKVSLHLVTQHTTHTRDIISPMPLNKTSRRP